MFRFSIRVSVRAFYMRYLTKNADDIPWRVQAEKTKTAKVLHFGSWNTISAKAAIGEREPSLREEARKSASRQPYRAALLCGNKVTSKDSSDPTPIGQ